MPTTRTSIFLTSTDKTAIRRLQARYGLATMSDAIRFALRLTDTVFRGETTQLLELMARVTPPRAPLPPQLQARLAKVKQVSHDVERLLDHNAALLAQRSTPARNKRRAP